MRIITLQIKFLISVIYLEAREVEEKLTILPRTGVFPNQLTASKLLVPNSIMEVEMGVVGWTI
ncbi:hypothetical protein BK129_19010 [Paenibacillus amylolyticus]|nr:hypothetical protein BK129_19010 [Paenibacillus amylolyticus]